MPRPGNSWACSTNIFTLLAGKPCPGCTNPLFFLPLLDYCACVWDPHHTTCINKFKVIQRFAAKLATGLWFPGCQDPIQTLNWPPHAEKGKSCCCEHILLGGSIIPPLVFTPHPHPSPRLHQCVAFYHPITKTSAHLHSFFPSVVTLWNKLSS